MDPPLYPYPLLTQSHGLPRLVRRSRCVQSLSSASCVLTKALGLGVAVSSNPSNPPPPSFRAPPPRHPPPEARQTTSMASSPARPFASPLQRSSQGSPSMSSPTTSFGPPPLDPGAGGCDPPRLAQLSSSDQVAFSIFPLEGPSGEGEVRWRCFQAVSGTKIEAVAALDTVQRSVARAWSSVSESDELEEGQEPPVHQHLFSRSLLSALVPFSPKAFVKTPPQAPQPQPPQPSPESMGGPQVTSPTEILTGKEDGGEIWVFDVRTSADVFNALDTLHEGLPDCLRGPF